jgi:hypothetical protein
MKSYEQIRRLWRKKAEAYATKRNPQKCSCFPGAQQCGEWCPWHQDILYYMRAMEDHEDVILSKHKECPY